MRDKRENLFNHLSRFVYSTELLIKVSTRFSKIEQKKKVDDEEILTHHHRHHCRCPLPDG